MPGGTAFYFAHAIKHLDAGDLGSLPADDFSLEVIKFLSGNGLLSVDVQGFLRKVENEKVLAGV